MTALGVPQQVDRDPVGTALHAATAAIITLRVTNRRAARRLSLTLEQIASQHSSGILTDADTNTALARVSHDASRQPAA